MSKYVSINIAKNDGRNDITVNCDEGYENVIGEKAPLHLKLLWSFTQDPVTAEISSI